jgi:uncharacterized membrane protein YhaH (DUF805 family)
MGFVESIKYNFSHYADFTGRAPRSQFWWWVLFIWIVSFVLNIIDNGLGLMVGASTTDVMIGDMTVPIVNNGAGILSTIFSLAVLIPGLAVAVRRLHDTDRTGWWLLWGFLLTFVCLIGLIILLVFYIQRGTPGENKYGADPLPS